MDSIKIKNLTLSSNLKLNIIKEVSGYKKLALSFKSNQARINSREVKKDDIFFAVKGKKKMEINL